MSYDFSLFRPRAGEDPLDTARTGSADLPSTPLDPQMEALKRKVADALIAHNPKLEVFQLDYDAIATFENISVEEARRKFRYLELNGPVDDDNGIQITLFDDEASVTVPYWHESDKATNTFREIWNYLEIINRETGFLIYDPQSDRLIDLSASFDGALRCYSGGLREIRDSLVGGDAKRRPWWKFW